MLSTSIPAGILRGAGHTLDGDADAVVRSQSPREASRRDGGDVCSELAHLLDQTHERLRGGDVFNNMENLMVAMARLRAGAGPDPSAWARDARAAYLAHPIRPLVEQEPVTLHASERPRGYAGDAQLLDYIYGASPLPAGTTDLGRRLYEWGFQVPAQQSVRDRCELLRGCLDELSARSGGRADVLSVACGHLRELPRDGVRRFGRFVGLDQDPQSLALVRRELGAAGVDVIEGSIRRLAFGRLDLGRFDFVYSAGLYDYLADPIAARLSEALFAMLKPGGRLLIANFAPWLRDIGYMEAVMDWQLIYRGVPHMLLLSAGLPPAEVRQQRLFFDRPRNVCFLEVEKEGAGADGGA